MKKKRYLVYACGHPAFVTEILGRYRYRWLAHLAAFYYRRWTEAGSSWADAWVVPIEPECLPPARVHR